MSKAARSILVLGIAFVVFGSTLLIAPNFLANALRTSSHQQGLHPSAGFGDYLPRILLRGGSL
jgi:hypothetical protein